MVLWLLHHKFRNDCLEEIRTSFRSISPLAILASEDRKAFVMFGCEGKSWIAMGDPVGLDASADDVAWKFREACDENGEWPVFYQVNDALLGRYIEIGLSMIKLGETARVRLQNFSLQGGASKDLRYTNKKAIDSGLRFEIVSQNNVAELMPTLKSISDAWLGEKSSAEKRFLLGFFCESCLSKADTVIIRERDTDHRVRESVDGGR